MWTLTITPFCCDATRSPIDEPVWPQKVTGGNGGVFARCPEWLAALVVVAVGTSASQIPRFEDEGGEFCERKSRLESSNWWRTRRGNTHTHLHTHTPLCIMFRVEMSHLIHLSPWFPFSVFDAVAVLWRGVNHLLNWVFLNLSEDI